jgi:hypothetical protein
MIEGSGSLKPKNHYKGGAQMTKQRFFTVVVVLCAASVLSVAGLLYAEDCDPCKGGAIPTQFEIKGGEGEVKVDVVFTKLKPSSPYVLCLNGRENYKDSNELLFKNCPEKSGNLAFCNFATKFSDDKGKLEYHGSYSLLKGKYNLKFLLKDKGNDYCSIFCDDNVSFTVR